MLLADISQILASEVMSKFDHVGVIPEVSYPEAQHGDFASNVAFQLSRELKMAPPAIAQKIIEGFAHPNVETITATRGFINLRMKPDFWLRQLHELSPQYGKQDLGRGAKVQVEFISANPTGPLTLGNARGGYIGDAISRVLAWTGYEVAREYYFNDAGSQIKKLVETLENYRTEKPDPQKVHYQGTYMQDLAADPEVTTENLPQVILERFIRGAIERMGIKFDVWFNEKNLITSGAFDEAIKLLVSRGLSYEKDGALWLKSTSYGDERDRVLRKSNGDVTYLATDIAYHLNIFKERAFVKAIKVWGADHAGQVPSLKLTVNQLAPEAKLDFVIMQFVRLMQDGQEVKMSKRAGNFVTVDDLLDEVPSDVARFFFLMRSADSHMDFDLNLAKEQSQKNPLYYVMYSYARAHSIIEQAEKRKLVAIDTLENLSDREIALVRQMARWPQLLTDITGDYSVHRLTFFGIELAKSFHDLYEGARIIDLDKVEACKKLYVIQQYIGFMEAFFTVLGVNPQPKMHRTLD
jgi:arginyl-tRNA synthetase